MRNKMTNFAIAGLLLFLGCALCLDSRPLRAQNVPDILTPSPDAPLAWRSFEVGELYGRLAGSGKSESYCVVASRVISLAGDVIPGATVRVRPALLGEPRVLKTNASGIFQTVYFMKGEYAKDFKVWLTVKKPGFQTAHELVDYSHVPKPTRAPITLRPEHEDPALLSQQELLSGLLPRLKSLGPADGLAAKSRKKYAKGIREFVDKKQPDRALSELMDVARRNPECGKCQTMLALAELDSGNWDGAARRADLAIKKANENKLQPGGSLEALVLAGVMESWMHRPRDAASLLFHANRLEPGNGLILQELGRAFLLLQGYGQAEAYLASAIKAGAGPEARLLRVRALLGAHQFDEANREMERYRDGRKVKNLPLEARKVWAEVQALKQVKALYGQTPRAKKKGAFASIDYLHDSARQLQGLKPARNQDELKPILAEVGKNVAALFRSFQDSTSRETIHQERLRHNGKVAGELNEQFRYLFLMPEDSATPVIREYRRNVNPVGGLPSGLEKGYMLTSGFVAAELVFHPDFQPGTEFRYLGRQKVDGHETYVIAFAQIPMRARLVGTFRLDAVSVPTLEQGLAWVEAQTYQIVRLRTDLLKPLPEVHLSKVTTQIDYHEVRFKQIAQGFWLPKEVTVTVDWRGRMLRNQHQYSDFKLFNVRASERIHTPKPSKEAANSSSPRQ